MSAVTADALAGTVRDALRRSYGHLHCATKIVAGKIGVDTRAFRNWWEGQNAPRSDQLIRLMDESDEVLAAVLEMANERELAEHVRARVRDAIRNLEGSRE